MRKRLLVLLAATALLAGFGTVAVAEPRDASPAGLDRELLDETIAALHEAGVPGVVAEVRDGDDTWSGVAGERRIGSGAPPKATDRVRIASLTKTMVSIVMLQLAEDGEVALDDEIGDLLPGLLPYEEPITVRQLLNHTSGIDDHFYDIYPSMKDGSVADVEANRNRRFSPEEIIASVTKRPLLFEPGSSYQYSNTNYYVLGLLAEKLTGESIESTLTERVLEPSGMDNSYLPRDTATIRGPHPNAYFATGEADRPLLDLTRLSSTHLWAAGSAISSPGDVNDMYRAMTDGTLLSAEQLAEAREITPQSKDHYGLGLEAMRMPEGCQPVEGGTAFGHTGGGMGYSTFSFHSPDASRQTTITFTLDVQLADKEMQQRVGKAFLNLFNAGMCDLPPASTGGAAVRAPLPIDVR